MKNKTVTLDWEREAFEASGVASMLSRSTEPGYTDQYASPATNMALRGWQARAALAEPVPHAGEEVDCEVCHGSGVLPGLTVKVTKCSYCGNGWKTIAQAEAELRLGDQAHVTRLQTEVERLKDEAGIYRTGYTLLKEELTKARECLKDLGVDWPEVSDMYQSAPAAKDESHDE